MQSGDEAHSCLPLNQNNIVLAAGFLITKRWPKNCCFALCIFLFKVGKEYLSMFYFLSFFLLKGKHDHFPNP